MKRAAADYFRSAIPTLMMPIMRIVRTPPIKLVDIAGIREGVVASSVGTAAIRLAHGIAGGGTIRPIVALALGKAAARAQRHY